MARLNDPEFHGGARASGGVLYRVVMGDPSDEVVLDGQAATHSRRSRVSAPSVSGFTLIELLIALALIALIMLLLFSGLRLGSRAWEGVDALAERQAEQRIARGFMLRSLREARTVSVRVDDRDLPVFAGDAERLELAAPLSERVGIGGLYLLRFSLEAVDDERSGLVVTRWLLHPDVLNGTDEIPPWEPLTADTPLTETDGELDDDTAAGAYGKTLLLADVESLEIAYFGRVPGEDEPVWLDEWIEQPLIPQLVLVRLATGSGAWPDLLVAMPAGG